MSGGSFNYLYSRPLTENSGDVKEMYETLVELVGGKYAECIKDTKAIIDAMDTIDKLQNKLGDLWHDIEWWKSADYSKLQAIKAVAKYEEENVSDQGRVRPTSESST